MKRKNELRIAVSVNGEGLGHLTRMTALARRLEKRYELGFWCPDSIREDVSRTFPKAAVRSVPSLSFVMNGAGIDYGATAAANLAGVFSSGAAVSALAGELQAFRAAGVLSDFEPFLAEAAGRLGLPILQLNHPGIVTRIGSNEPDALIAKFVAVRMMGRFDRLVLSSFYEGDVGPILRPEINRLRRAARRDNTVLVYAKDEFRDRLQGVLDGIPGFRFRFFPNPREEFLSALESCCAVIAPSGHQMASEALCLSKPIFAIPISGQYEQRLNGEMLQRSGWGAWGSADGFEDPLRRFLSELDSYPRIPDPAIRFRFQDDGIRAASVVRNFFARGSRRGENHKAYTRITWPMGRLVAMASR